jgi:hypothetical protein
MHPSKQAEFVVGMLIPPACREEVLGDLYERYRSLLRYSWDAVCIVPPIILSRIRRTSDPLVVLTQSLALYTSYLCAARIASPKLLVEPWGLLRLAAPVFVTVAGIALDDAYADPSRSPALGPIRAALTGIGLALWSQVLLWAGGSQFAIPYATMAYGCVLSLVFTTGIRILFPPASNQLRGVTAPAAWLKQSAAPLPADLLRIAKGMVPFLTVLLTALVAWQLWKRAVP